MNPRRTPSKRVETSVDVEEGSITPPRRTSPPYEVSPAGTFDTALTSPTASEPANSKITIEHSVKGGGGSGSRGRGAGLILGMSKPVLAIVAMLVLGSGAAAAFGWFQIPGLNDQIVALEEQVNMLNAEIDRLAGQVDRLESENDRYESLNNDLNETVAEFEVLTQNLNFTVEELEEIKDSLNLTNINLSEKVEELASENEHYESLNKELNATASRLTQEVNYFQNALQDLVLENNFLSNLTEALEGMTLQLGNLTAEQNQTLLEMQETLAGFMLENDRLQELNTNLVTIVNFLNQTSVDLDGSLQQITVYLAEQITVNQVLVLRSLENTYRQRISNWDCDYRDVFRDQSFGQNFSLPITDTSRVLEYVENRVLDELCLDVSDFETFLFTRFTNGLTTSRLVTGLSEYTDAALEYYFPVSGQEGVTHEEWSDASYRCENLTNKYVWNKAS